MPSPFAALDARLQGDIDATFGGGVTIRPMAGDPNYGGAADQSRPVRTGVRATVSREPGPTSTDFVNSNRAGAPMALGPSEAWLDRAAVTALGYALKRGDIIEFPEDGDPAPRAVIAEIRKGDFGDLTITFAAAGAAAP